MTSSVIFESYSLQIGYVYKWYEERQKLFFEIPTLFHGNIVENRVSLFLYIP